MIPGIHRTPMRGQHELATTDENAAQPSRTHTGISAESLKDKIVAASENANTATPTSLANEPDGLGKDGTIPANPDGLAAGYTDTPSHFNAEEDEDAN